MIEWVQVDEGELWVGFVNGFCIVTVERRSVPVTDEVTLDRWLYIKAATGATSHPQSWATAELAQEAFFNVWKHDG